ncbi:Chromatin assembly factor 1 subunit FAS2 [Galdieria sulphuraria]|nr:Chromatin assembly factor 1 subunit FAS2 [Galdieria sulphuraria]
MTRRVNAFMKSKLLQVSWHEKQPIWSIDISPCTGRLLTTGSDRVGRLWLFTIQDSLEYNLQWIGDLKGHDSTVNVGRFNPKGNKGRYDEDLIATGSDGGTIVLWERVTEDSLIVDHKIEETLERWRIHHILRKHLEDVLDLQWSCCGRYLISGSVDNKVIIWDIYHWNATRVLEGHHHFVQGVAVDPLGEYFSSQSADRSVRIYQKTKNKNGSFSFPCKKSIGKIENEDCLSSSLFLRQHLFLDDSHRCMFRRMDWSPDGSFLICPAAQNNDLQQQQQQEKKGYDKPYAALLFARGYWEAPIFQFLGYDQPAMIVKVCPLLWERTYRMEKDDTIQLPYYIIFAIATLDTVFLYNIDEPFPIGYVKGMHWQPITDLCWSQDGHYLLVCSMDGYLSVIYFESDELGKVLDMTTHPTKLENQKQPPKNRISNTRYITQWITSQPKRMKTK